MMDFSKVPNANLTEGLRLYFEHHRPTGGFLTAVLENDLRAACERADMTNRRMLFDIVSWLYNEAPAQAWGSKERVERWLAGPEVPS
jgi:hypothetical protein